MAVVLPHNLTNNTKPDADQVMGNFNALLGATNAMKTKSGYSGASSHATWAGSDLSAMVASESVTVAVPSFAMIAAVGNWCLYTSGTSSAEGTLQIVLDGTGQGIVGRAGTVRGFTGSPGGNGGYAWWEKRNITALANVGLAVGTHTVALLLGSTIERGSWTGAANADAYFQDSAWVMTVIPQ